MRFKTDENIHPEIAELLRAQGHDAMTVWDQSLRGATDFNLSSICAAEGRILFTLDLDFADIRIFPPKSHPGIVVFRLADQSRTSLLAATRRLLPLLMAQPISQSLWIVEDSRIRVRSIE